MDVNKDGQSWRIGTAEDAAWLAGQTTHGFAITVAIPPVFDAYATCHEPDGVDIPTHERALVAELTRHSGQQPWWLGYLDSGAHDIVFPHAPTVSLYMQWPYVLVEAGPEQALSWRTGNVRGGSAGAIPELIFPADRSWLVSTLWDDGWISIGGPTALIGALQANPDVNARALGPDDDALPPGLTRY